MREPIHFYKELESLISLIICYISSWLELVQIHNSHCRNQEEMSKMYLTPQQNETLEWPKAFHGHPVVEILHSSNCEHLGKAAQLTVM